ncbi:MAG: NUDIX domain-containing protein [Candidatus Omnitrophica bacterium]|nr:NUDIX domain-containing protein [Candidatus Omnitrophota bacterium]
MTGKPVLLVLRGIIRNDEGRYLLMKRSRNSLSWPGYWEFPGGKVNPGEAHEAAFIREMMEETGFSVRPAKLFAEFEWERAHDIVLYRIFIAGNISGEFKISEEHDDFGWFLSEEMKELNVSSPLLQIIKKL